MSKPIDPRMAIDTLVLQTTGIDYQAKFNGVSWVITPADIRLTNRAQLAGHGGPVSTSDLVIPMSDLPVGAQNALQQLHDYIEQIMADEQNNLGVNPL